MMKTPQSAMVLRLLVTVLTFATLGAAPRSNLALHVDLSERSLEVRLNGERVKSYMVGIGKEKYPTPTGRFLIRRVVWNPKWVPPRARWAIGRRATPPGHPKNPMKVAKIFFKMPDYYIHGTAEDLSIGEEASHGCLRMSPSEVRELGEMVMNHGGRPRADSWYSAILGKKRETAVRLRVPVPIHIVP